LVSVLFSLKTEPTPIILPEHLDADDPAQVDFPVAEVPGEPLPLRALLACGGNRTRTAERLGISRRQLFDKIREYDLGA
jgi:two-component system response regulator AtoC